MTKQDTLNAKLNIKDISFINTIRSIAVIGSSKRRDYSFLRRHAELFKGPVYAVHPTATEIPRFDDGTQNKIYKSVDLIPEDIDYVFISTPASQILDVIDGCIKKGVKLASIFTAGLADLGTEEGIQLEKELINKLNNSMRILGPNCLGLFYPKRGISWRGNFPAKPGNIGFIAQSGGICDLVVFNGEEMGIYFSKVFSYGNGNDLDVVDLLYFLSNDPETDIILCYLEGMNDKRGDALRQVLAQNKKPIICLKAGKSQSAVIAAKTHTASIAGEYHIWKAIFNQYNVIEVKSVEHLISAAKLIDCYGVFKLKSAAVLVLSGGYGVVLTDLLEEEGISVPPFSPEIQNQIDQKFKVVGTGTKNPLDVSGHLRNLKLMHELIELALSDTVIDGIITVLPAFYLNYGSRDGRRTQFSSFEKPVAKIMSLGHKYNKPIIIIMQGTTFPKTRENFAKEFAKIKVPMFRDPYEFISLLPKISKYSEEVKKRK